MKLVLKLGISTLAVLLIAKYLQGVNVNGFTIALSVALVLAIFNLTIKPIVKIFSLPITIMTLGLFSIVVNAALVKLADYLIDGFSVNSFLVAIEFSLILSATQLVTNLIIKIFR